MEIFFYSKDVEARANKKKKDDERDRGTPFWGEKKNTEEVKQASFEVSFYYFDLTGGAVMRNENTVTLNR